MSALDAETITLGGLFIAGLATSLHCAGMCGLLTCGLGIAGRGPALASVGVYHFCRLVAYSVAGALAGTIGKLFGLEHRLGGIPLLPIFLVIFLLAIVFGLDRKLASFPGLGRAAMSLRARTMTSPPMVRAAAVGLLTPLLPCGPLYAMLALSVATGSTLRGAESMLAFGLGALPAIWAVQIGSSWGSRKLSARGFLIAKRSLAALAAISLLWHFGLPGIGKADAETAQEASTCRCSVKAP